MNAAPRKLLLAAACLLAGAALAADFADAEVRKVDKDNNKLTLKHGEIKNLDMPPMTMVFQVKDPAMLDKVKAGDKIRFTATQEAGKYTVTEIQPAR
jgi:Cu(I)/Ag(I) efflux system periplasmic protein CusF